MIFPRFGKQHWVNQLVCKKTADAHSKGKIHIQFCTVGKRGYVMQYRKFGNTGVEVSALGFGAMRLPVTDPSDSKSIDEKEAVRMIRTAIDNGVNYVDTAYPYHGGMSEVVVGKALQDGYREKTMLATKLPVWMVQKEEDFDRILNEQLEKLQTDHVDFYLLHALNKDRWKTVEECHLLKKLDEAKADGRIRFAGFSFHDDLNTFKEIVDAFHWDFCQIQFNYIDLEHQAGMQGLKYAASKGLGVVIMEPLLGGKLAVPPLQVQKVLPDTKTPVEWALDFLWNLPEVSLMLSGMSTMQQPQDNLMYADRSHIGMLSGEDVAMLGKAKHIYDTMAIVPCTKCAYCMPCPFGLDIPKTFEAYNQTATKGMEKAKELYDTLEKKADACRKCRHCEKECPQHIEISQIMTDIVKVFA